MSDVQSYAARFVVDQWMERDIPEEYLHERISTMERDAIYQAVKQVGNDKWICIRPELVKQRDMYGNYEYLVHVHVRQVETAKVYVFEDYQNPIVQRRIPKDLYFCYYCGGHTKNDMRGHCSACGGPRKDYNHE